MAIKQKTKPAKAPAKPAAKITAPAKAVAAPKTTAVAVQGDVTEQELLADAKMGTSATTSQDLAIPFVMLLQKLSPECDKQDPKYIEGAEEGMIIEKASNELWDGETGVLFIPCYYERRYTEWRTRAAGGGLVRDWGNDPSRLTECTKNDRGKDITPDGNEFVASGMHYVLLVDPETHVGRPAVVSMSSTQLKHSRRWNTAITNLRIPHPRDPAQTFQPASFYMAYRATSKPESNQQGNWMGWNITPERPTAELPGGANLYRMAKAFCASVEKGEVRAAPAPADAVAGGGEPAPDGDIPF